MPNLNLPTNITPGVTNTFELDVEAAWAELNALSVNTGWRNVTSLLINGWTASSVLLRRVADRVDWQFLELDGETATDSTSMSMTSLSGFRVPGGGAIETPEWRGTTSTGFARFSTGGLAMPVGFKSRSATRFIFSYFTPEGVPSTLPGTPV